MKNPLPQRLARLRAKRADNDEIAQLRKRISSLENAIFESRALNERVADVVDVVVELLVPAVDRDEERLRQLLDRLDAPTS